MFILYLISKSTESFRHISNHFINNNIFYMFTESTINVILRLLRKLYMQLVGTNSMLTLLKVSLFINMKYFIILLFVKVSVQHIVKVFSERASTGQLLLTKKTGVI